MTVGTKTITTTRTVHVCDCCDEQIVTWQSCKICDRDIGDCCLRRFFAHSPNPRLALSVGFYACKDCEEAGQDVAGTPFIDLIRDKVKEADAYVLGVLERWRTWAKERREKGGAT